MGYRVPGASVCAVLVILAVITCQPIPTRPAWWGYRETRTAQIRYAMKFFRKKALTFTPRPSYKNIQVILSTGQDKTKKSQQTEASSSDAYGFTRGADYYGGED